MAADMMMADGAIVDLGRCMKDTLEPVWDQPGRGKAEFVGGLALAIYWHLSAACGNLPCFSSRYKECPGQGAHINSRNT